MKIVIGEDEPLVAEHLNELVSGFGYTVCAVEHDFQSVKEAVELFKPDLVLLDIRMDTKSSGLKLASILNNMSIPFVFITAHSDEKTLSEAALLNPSSYIVKPFNKDQIGVSLKLAHSKIGQKVIQLKVDKDQINVSLNKILYLHAQSNYTDVYTNEKKLVVRGTLSSILKEMGCAEIQRIHKSFAVNTSKIDQIKSGHLLVGEIEIPYSKMYLEKINHFLNESRV